MKINNEVFLILIVITLEFSINKEVIVGKKEKNYKVEDVKSKMLYEIELEIKSTEDKIKELKYNLFHDSEYDINYYLKNKNIYSKENLAKIESFIRLIEYEEQLSFVEESK